jgi:hypothetical protein
MPAKPPSSSEGSDLPPRHRPTLGNLAQDTTEIDLWDFDEEFDGPEVPADPVIQLGPRMASGEIPSPRPRAVEKPRLVEDTSDGKSSKATDKIRIDVNKPAVKNRHAGQPSGPSKPERDFDDLEHWDDAKTVSEIGELPTEASLEPSELAERQAPVVPQMPVSPATQPSPGSPEPSPDPTIDGAPKPADPVPAVKLAEDDEFTPVVRENAVPVSLRPHLKLSKIERIGLVMLVALLLVGGATVFLSSIYHLPKESQRAKANDFPIKGEILTIQSAKTYWRTPVMEGPSPDTFRRGTELLPVIELATSGPPAALRLLFRNEERAVIGDAVTRTIRSDGTVAIPATAGFDDLGMHAAYRTGESKPWTIEIFEAATADAPGTSFKKLFEINISTDRR